jgi:uncharacterized protein with PQ loop repeat
MNDTIINIAGWIPAIAIPSATLAQLFKILGSRKTAGVSVLSWGLFGVANLGIYIFTEKYFAIQSILAQLLTAILNFVIVFSILALRDKKKHD